MKRSPAIIRVPLALLLLLCFSVSFSAQEAYDVRANYEKSEYQIPMRDGVKLFTVVYAPRDKSKKYPILLNRTPYSVGPYGPDAYKTSLGPSPLFMKEGYIFVYQDVRGRYMSEGEFVNMRPHKERKSGPTDIDESTDTYDTIDWLIKNVPNNNGRVGMWGISYPGFYVAVGMIDAHPALKAASPQAPIADWFIGDDFHHNGAFFLPHAFNFLATFGRPRPRPTTETPPRFQHGTPDGYKFFLELGPLQNADRKYFKGQVAFWNEIMEHPNYDDFWKARNTLPHLKNIHPAVMTVGGWFDAEDLYGALKTYEATEKQSPGAYNTLVMGPWYHGGWARSDGDSLGPIQFGSKTAEFYRREIELPFFNCFLKDKCDHKLPEAYVFETGSNRWRMYAEWPPRTAQPRAIYLRENGKLSFDPPTDERNAFDEYVSDPNKPVPYINGIAIGMTREYMVEDQRFAARRPDVLAYQTEPLAQDLTAAGPVKVTLYVSSTGTDADYIVKLIDVFPDDAPDPEPNPTGVRMGGYQMLVRGEPFRARFRNSFERPEPLPPGEVTKIEFVMPDINHTFLKGHRIMVQVQSTWFPLVDRNPQKFVPNIYKAGESDFQKATQRVHRSRAYASRITLNVVP
ncbi:MAG: X-Pro dipeptidyl-peptidase [Pyrinomonas sp.]|uniref:CocE/NonD family hydrolase n=1 Tax=Pyrinomonas sp. TaxID=2080306 RepID=UPI0033205F34